MDIQIIVKENYCLSFESFQYLCLNALYWNQECWKTIKKEREWVGWGYCIFVGDMNTMLSQEEKRGWSLLRYTFRENLEDLI